MEEIYTKIQVYLLKKDKECEKLRFLTSRTTPSNDAHVSDVCETIKSILQDSTSFKDGEKEKSIRHFKFLLLNTNFRCQEYLCEDIVNGYLVDMCPPLSPYLFIQIIWALNYDDIIANSVLYIPLDLCSEILNAMRRCLDVDFERTFNLVLEIISNCYKKLVSIVRKDIQILEEEESLKGFMGSVQEMISSVADLPSKNIETLSQLLKYERCGWVLIKLLNAIKNCIECKRTENYSLNTNQELEKLYGVTFGRNFIVKLNPDVLLEAVDFFTKELIELLLKSIKKIDCFIYMGWAELDYKEDTSMSMQRAVGLACYRFIEFLQSNNNELENHSHVIECLEQLSSKPDAPFSMSLKELCDQVERGNKECLRNLIERFEEWDSSSISCFDENQSIIEKRDCLSLLDSASKFLAISSERELCTRLYTTVMKILLGQRLIDLVEIVVEYILIHDAGRKLESTNFETDLKAYVNQGLALCSGKTSLRIILFFVIQNPREVLKTLIKAGIGYPQYTNSMLSPEDFCKLSPIMQIRDSNNLSLLLNALKLICAENISWNSKKFVDLINMFLDEGLISADELANNIFIPIFKNEITLTNIQTILICIRTMKKNFTPKMKKHELLHALALQMMYLRNNDNFSINRREELLNLLIRIIHRFSNIKLSNSSIDEEADVFSEKLEASLEPLDKIYFATHRGWLKNEISIDRVLHDYKKRCIYIINESKGNETRCADFEQFLKEYGLNSEDFLQYLILRCTEFEYSKFGKEALIIYWNYFGWKNEVDAYAQFSLATIKACNNYLESFDRLNRREYLVQKISSLIKSLANLSTWFIDIDEMKDYESVHKSLVFAMNSINLNRNIFPDLLQSYEEFKVSLNELGMGTAYSYELVVELIGNVNKFGDQCSLSHCSQEVEKEDPKSLSASQYYLKSRFISICSNWPLEENNLLLSKIDKKLYSE